MPRGGRLGRERAVELDDAGHRGVVAGERRPGRAGPRRPSGRRSRTSSSECWSRRSSTAASSALLFRKWCSSPASLIPTSLGDLAQRAGPVAGLGEHLERRVQDRRAGRAGLRILAARLAPPRGSGPSPLGGQFVSVIVSPYPRSSRATSIGAAPGSGFTISVAYNENLVIARFFRENLALTRISVSVSRQRRSAGASPQIKGPRMFRWKAAAATIAIAAHRPHRLRRLTADDSGRRRRRQTAHPRRHHRPDDLRPGRRRVGQPHPVLPGRVRHAAAGDAEGDDRALARHRVGVQRRQHRAHAHAPRRRRVHRRHAARRPRPWSQNLERFKDGTAPDAGYFAGIESSRRPTTPPSSITLPRPTRRCSTTSTRDPGLIAAPRTFDEPDSRPSPIGSGPYVLDTAATVTGTSYVYTANPDYWNPDVQHYDNLTINVLADPTAALNAIKAGEANGVEARRPTTTSPRSRAPAGRSTPTSSTSRACCCSTAPARWHPGSPTSACARRSTTRSTARRCSTALQSGLRHRDHAGLPDHVRRLRRGARRLLRVRPRKAKELLAEAGYADGFTLSMPSSTAARRGDLHARSRSSSPTSASRLSTPTRATTSSPTCSRRSTRRRSWRSSRTPTGSSSSS